MKLCSNVSYVTSGCWRCSKDSTNPHQLNQVLRLFEVSVNNNVVIFHETKYQLCLCDQVSCYNYVVNNGFANLTVSALNLQQCNQVYT